jgi:hypothetical protein
LECEKNLNLNNNFNNNTNKKKEEVFVKKNSSSNSTTFTEHAEPDIVLSRDYNENPIFEGKIFIILYS